MFPEPVIHVAVEPKTKADQEKMGIALNRLAQEDPSFRVRTDEESGQTIISGMGELHLEIIVDRMKREFKRRGERRQAAGRLPRDAPQSCATRSKASSSSQSGGRGQYGHVWLKARAATNPARATSSSTLSRAARCPASTFRRCNKGVLRKRSHDGRARRLPGGRCQGHPVRRFVPRCRLERERPSRWPA